jgi:flagellar motor switch protein FliN
MSDTLNYLDCWTLVATSLFSQALVGEPALSEALPKPMLAGSFGFAAQLEGDEEGRFSVMLDGALAEAGLLGDGVDQKEGWAELLREVCDAAVGELLAKTGRKARIKSFAPIEAESKLSRAFQLKAGERSWAVQVNSAVKLTKAESVKAGAASTKGQAAVGKPASGSAATGGASPASVGRSGGYDGAASGRAPAAASGLSPGLELLLDVELEATLRFGAKEMPLCEILDLGPGDVVQLDRHIHDPVDLLVGDKIIARGEVVLINGNFGLRVIEVAEPQRRLESIRCLF